MCINGNVQRNWAVDMEAEDTRSTGAALAPAAVATQLYKL